MCKKSAPRTNNKMAKPFLVLFFGLIRLVVEDHQTGVEDQRHQSVEAKSEGEGDDDSEVLDGPVVGSKGT